ncbi:MAG: hypothetical protein WA139_05705 [Candidatus Aenigmatarchaeota archaeon]
MVNELSIPEEIRQVSQNIKIVHFGIVIKREDPWKNLIGKITMKQKVSIEDMMHFKGFEDVS